MPSIALYTEALPQNVSDDPASNSLPTTLQTPSGLAILEIQGTIHAPLPQQENENASTAAHDHALVQTSIGRLEFPLFDPEADPGDQKWMKRIYLYVGKHQRLTGEVKKLPKPLVVIGRRAEQSAGDQTSDNVAGDNHNEELEILEIIKYKILFGGRPEPVGE